MRRSTYGFTLIEVLIALGLSVMLLSAVYSAIELHYRFQTAGRAEIRGQQLLRSLTRKFSQDIGSIVIKSPESTTTSTSGGQAADEAGASSSSRSSGSSSTGNSSSASSSSESSSSSSSDNTSSMSATGPVPNFSGLGEAGLPVVFGVIGTSELLHLSVSLPTRDLNYVGIQNAGAPTDRSGDLQIVTIGLTSIDAVSMSILQKNLKTDRPSVGLGRRVRDLFSQFESDEALEPRHLLAPEVTELAFRYFDSGEWFPSWDSVAMGRLPRAIEMDFGFWNPPPVQIGRTNHLDKGTVTHVQYVFNIPLSCPTVE